MKIRISDDEPELTAVSYVNGVLIGVDENLEDYYENEDEPQKTDTPKKRLKKDPEDNLGSAVAFLDTDKIERGVDFLTIKKNMDFILESRGWTLSDFFKSDDTVAEFCAHYEYTLPNFVRLMMEHMPDVVNLAFLRSTVRPVISALQKMKTDFENGNVGGRGYRKIFAYL